MENRTYIAIDLKSFYASVECMERGLNPMTANLVVADASRTEKTICLAVSPSLKAYGIPGRARLFEVVQKVKEINSVRKQFAPGHVFTGSSCLETELKCSPGLSLDYLVAPPRMGRYIECSAKIYNIYLKYIAPEDIHVYSIDEVIIDATAYLATYRLTPRELAMKMILDVLNQTGITATAGIGPNLYLCKIAMDIWAKHIPPDKNGVRIAKLNEMSYRRLLWQYRPLTDFWRIGKGYAKKLEEHGIYTMGDVARCSLGGPNDYYNEGLLYQLFGINAELLIDHAWGYEPCTMADIKAYKPEVNSICSGQVLQSPYRYDKAKLVLQEMTESLALDLVDKGVVTNQMVLTIGYDTANLKDPEVKKSYQGDVKKDRYGRLIPRHAHGTANLGCYTSSAKKMWDAVSGLFLRITDQKLLVRRISLTANHVVLESEIPEDETYEQLSLFTDIDGLNQKRDAEKAELEREKRMQKAVLQIQKRFGKNAVLKGLNLQEGATAIERNGLIGGHKK